MSIGDTQWDHFHTGLTEEGRPPLIGWRHPHGPGESELSSRLNLFSTWLAAGVASPHAHCHTLQYDGRISLKPWARRFFIANNQQGTQMPKNLLHGWPLCGFIATGQCCLALNPTLQAFGTYYPNGFNRSFVESTDSETTQCGNNFFHLEVFLG